MIYLDSAATTLYKPKGVYENTNYALRNMSSPGRGQYHSASKASEVVYNCREKASKLFNVAEPDNVIMTFNATHGLNIAIGTLAFKGCRAVVSGYEHNAVMRPLRHFGADINIVRSELFDPESAIKAFDKAIDNNTDIVVCSTMSNVFGYILPVYEIAEICKERKVPLVIDASQGAGVLDLDFQKLGAAFMAMPGHKGLYGPQGTGLLLCSKSIKPLLTGGTGSSSLLKMMPETLPDAGEAGTLNVHGIAGLAAGLDYVLKVSPKNIMEHERRLLNICAKKLSSVKGIKLFRSNNEKVQGGVLSFLSDSYDPVVLAERLATHGVCVRAGYHCAPEAHQTAGTIDTGTVRISLSAFSAISEINKFISIIKSII